MPKAIIFDCFGVLVMDSMFREFKNKPLLAYIKQLKANYKTALLSNVSSSGLRARFTDSELAEHFDAIVTSGDIGFAKPEAEAYEITADRLGVRFEDCIMVDDREDYCQGAIGVGMQAVLYHDFDQLQKDLAKLI